MIKGFQGAITILSRLMTEEKDASRKSLKNKHEKLRFEQHEPYLT